jgi:hypothetical protein
MRRLLNSFFRKVRAVQTGSPQKTGEQHSPSKRIFSSAGSVPNTGLIREKILAVAAAFFDEPEVPSIGPFTHYECIW